MHAARLDRLQRVYKLLLDGVERSTLDIELSAAVRDVPRCIGALRAAGAEITRRRIVNPANGAPIRMYRMTAPVPIPLPAGGGSE